MEALVKHAAIKRNNGLGDAAVGQFVLCRFDRQLPGAESRTLIDAGASVYSSTPGTDRDRGPAQAEDAVRRRTRALIARAATVRQADGA